MGRYPVTVQEHRQFVEAGGYRDKQFWRAGGFGESTAPGAWDEQLQYPNRPVVNVSWYEAAAYCAWAGVRLPTDEEWERAARGAEGREYPWGNEEPDPNRANYDEGKVGAPTPVGLYPKGATPEGIMDMAGNVWEWTADWYDEDRSVRGGSWFDLSRGLRAARVRGRPVVRCDYVGFRCVREIP
jgi:serine/threonine-protein kinase